MQSGIAASFENERLPFTALPILAQPTGDPTPFIQWSSTTKIMNRDQPTVRMEAELCESLNAAYTGLL